MKIKAVGRQEEGGGYYRIRQPLGELAKHGHDVTIAAARSDVFGGGAEVVVGQMIGGKHFPTVIHHWWRQLAKHSKLVYELDDDPFEVEAHNPAYGAYSGPVSHDSLTHCIQISDLVTVSTEPLADRMRKLNPNVVVLQNRIDEHMLEIQRTRREKLTIGWSGSNSHAEDIKVGAYGLRKTLDRNPDVEAHFIGADYRPLIGRPMRHTGWCTKTVDFYKLIDFDIGLAPMAPTVFAETKSHIRALEYAALGIPVIASDVAPYRDFVIDGVTGFLVRRDHEWATRLRELVNDEALRTSMGQKAKEVAAEYTIQKGWPEWEACYASLL